MLTEKIHGRQEPPVDLFGSFYVVMLLEAGEIKLTKSFEQNDVGRVGKIE